jgi:hypothetical protein
MGVGAARGFSDFFGSMGPYRAPISGPTGYEDVNEIAQQYYLSVYGGANFSVSMRRIRLGIAVTALFISWYYFGCAAWFYTQRIFYDTTPSQCPHLTLASIVFLVFDVLVIFSIYIQQRLAFHTVQKRTTYELRRLWANQLTLRLGGPKQFLVHVKTKNNGQCPNVSAWFLAPFWGEYIASLLVSSVPIWFAAVAFLWKASAAHTRPSVFLVLCVLCILCSLYICGVVTAMTPTWTATHRGPRYFPLQVMCKDLGCEYQATSGSGHSVTTNP